MKETMPLITYIGAYLVLSFYPLFVKTERYSTFFNIRKNAALLTNEGIMARKRTADLMTCASLCGREALCESANFDERQKVCALVKGSADPNKLWTEKDNFIGLEKFYHQMDNTMELPGTARERPVPNCKYLLTINPASTSGVYWIDPDGISHDNAFEAYCDQVTDGGGWTLVWSYHFTDYTNFNSQENAVTPRPNWVVVSSDVDISTTPPLSETQYDAVEFSLWKEIGSEVLIKSNINNWITCKPGTGSLVDWVTGSVTCHLVKTVNPACSGVLPNKFKFKDYGPGFSQSETRRTFYYYFDGSKDVQRPFHDPCCQSSFNQLTGIENPHGNLFIR